jgi:hypothetical protein
MARRRGRTGREAPLIPPSGGGRGRSHSSSSVTAQAKARAKARRQEFKARETVHTF